MVWGRFKLPGPFYILWCLSTSCSVSNLKFRCSYWLVCYRKWLHRKQTLMDIFWNLSSDRSSFTKVNHYWTNSLHIWEKYRNSLASDLSPIPSLLNQKQFLPLDDAKEAIVWRQGGIIGLGDLFVNGRILEKQEFDWILNSKMFWFKYLQSHQ